MKAHLIYPAGLRFSQDRLVLLLLWPVKMCFRFSVLLKLHIFLNVKMYHIYWSFFKFLLASQKDKSEMLTLGFPRVSLFMFVDQAEA